MVVKKFCIFIHVCEHLVIHLLDKLDEEDVLVRDLQPAVDLQAIFLVTLQLLALGLCLFIGLQIVRDDGLLARVQV